MKLKLFNREVVFIRPYFVPNDLWIGIYWTKHSVFTLTSTDYVVAIYICIIPMFPFSVRIYGRTR